MLNRTLTYSRIVMLTCTVVVFVGGCASMHSQPHPFFLAEQNLESHGRKTWFDHLVEFDPGGIKVEVARDYAQNPPRRIAVLPFVDQGSAQFVVNKIPLSFATRSNKPRGLGRTPIDCAARLLVTSPNASSSSSTYIQLIPHLLIMESKIGRPCNQSLHNS